MQGAQTQTAYAAPVATPRFSSVRRVVATGLTTLATAMAVVIGLQTLFSAAPTSCGADCAAAFGADRFAVVLGVPAIAWATALHAMIWLGAWAFVALPRQRVLVQTAQLALVVALLAGSATYLVIGLVTNVRCKVCLTMHALAVFAALGVALVPRVREAPTPVILRRIAAAALAVAAWIGLAWGISQVAGRAKAAQAAPAASTDKWLNAVCEPSTCPGAARFGPEALPEDDASVVLGRGVGATLVAWLDLECAACRADFGALEPLLRSRQDAGRPTRLILRANARACDAQARGGESRACEAPTAVICAARHAGASAALDLLAWELKATPGYYTLADRRQALAAMSPMAARCLDSELALGARGALGAHSEAARRIAAQAQNHAGCAADAWWCFESTPSFAIVHATRPPPSATTAFATATGSLRRAVLEQCLESSP